MFRGLIQVFQFVIIFEDMYSQDTFAAINTPLSVSIKAPRK